MVIRRKRYKLRFCRLVKNKGECDRPDVVGKEIRIDQALRGQSRLDVLLHELLHAADWTKDEEWVEEVAGDIARILWRLGYRGEK